MWEEPGRAPHKKEEIYSIWETAYARHSLGIHNCFSWVQHEREVGMVALRYDCKLPGTYSFQPVSLEHGWVFGYSVKSRVVDGLLYYVQGWILKGHVAFSYFWNARLQPKMFKYFEAVTLTALGFIERSSRGKGTVCKPAGTGSQRKGYFSVLGERR